MSCMLLSPAHLAIVVEAAHRATLRVPGLDGVTRTVGDARRNEEITLPDGQGGLERSDRAIWRVLAGANAAAYAARYPKEAPVTPHPFDAEQYRRATAYLGTLRSAGDELTRAMVAIRAIDCLEYQIDEPVPEDDRPIVDAANRILTDLRLHVIRSIPAWEAAPWSFDEVPRETATRARVW